MAKTAIERKRLQLARERERARSQLDLVYGLPRPALGEWLDDRTDETELQQLAICYDGMGRDAPDFGPDTDPKSRTGHFDYPKTEDGSPSHRGSLGRAELEVELLLDAAATLAKLLNSYKRQVIQDRIAQIENEDLQDPQIRRQRLAEVVTLNKALDRLDKSVRTDVKQWQLRG